MRSSVERGHSTGVLCRQVHRSCLEGCRFVTADMCLVSGSAKPSADADVSVRPRWFLVFTKPSGEAKAKENLERQGYRVYYPRLRHPKLLAGRWMERIVALFPRYVFVQLTTGQSLAPVRSTFGVAAVVRFGHGYAVVPDAILDGLRGREDPTSGLHRLNRDRAFGVGAAVRVIAGTFACLDGVFEREAGDERIVVLLSLLGQHTRVQIPAQFVVARA